MARPESTGSEISVQITISAGGGELQRRTEREGDAAKLEGSLNSFVRFVALGEWAGNAFGALAFLWATGVLLGGFCTSLKSEDFWFATVMIFIEAFRIFSRNYRVDNQSLFGTTRALRWISSSFSCMFWRSQEGDEVVLFIGLWITLIDNLAIDGFGAIPEVALLVLTSRWPRWPRRFQTCLLIAYLVFAACQLNYDLTIIPVTGFSTAEQVQDSVIPTGRIIFGGIVAVLLLKLRPHRIVNLTSSPFGRKLISLAKGISAVWLVCDMVLDITLTSDQSTPLLVDYSCITSFTEVVLLLGSLQTPVNSDLCGRWIDAILRICFLYDLVFPLDSIDYILGPNPNSSQPSIAVLSFLTLVVLLLIGNLQIPAAVAQVLLSSMRFHTLISHHDYYPLPEDSSQNMVPAIEVFYMLALCQGSLYIMAIILGIFSFFPRRSLARQSKFSGRRGAKAIDLYYHHAYATCMDTGLLAARKTMSLASFAMESLCSSHSSEVQLAGLLLFDNLLSQDTNSSEELKSSIIVSSKEALSMLIGMLDLPNARDRDIRLFAARVTAKLAGSIRIAKIPGMLKLVSSLIDTENQLARQQSSVADPGGFHGVT